MIYFDSFTEGLHCTSLNLYHKFPHMLQTNRGYKKTNRNTDFWPMISVSYNWIRILKIARLRLAAIAIYLFYAMHCILCIHYMHYILCILLHALYSKHSILCILSHELYTIHVHVLCFSFYAFCSVHSNPYIFFQSYWCYMHIILEISFIHLTFCFFSH